MSHNLLNSLQSAFPDLSFEADKSLATSTYFKIGGPAEVYVEAADDETIAALSAWCHSHQLPLTILGGASNVIVADEGIRGLVLQLTNSEVQVVESDATHLLVGAGCKTAIAVKSMVDAQLTGLEYFLGVPGTIGGAIYNNAHYLEDLIGEHVHQVKVTNEQGHISWLTQEECQFGYDTSRFHATKEIVLQVEFALKKGSREASMVLIAEATKYRAATQPLGAPSSGCIFQNTPNTPELREKFPQFAERAFVGGGFLIDQAGLKGTKIGGISVSQKHAAFFVNDGTGTSQDVAELIALVKKTVKEKFDVTLQEEVFVLA